ncbi:MAG: AraC family transcriptional regulator [Acidiferrobacterales bacterium]|nr:AraC family transcriptional regulator [Acidiferrobacterales bacterium]
MKEITSKSYRQRLTNVIDYIHANFDSDLDVNTLAEVALMSPYHFHRIYRELAQETVNGTVRRLRLQRAAAELIRSNLSLTEIAKLVSYGSLEAFSRAFTKQFGESPSEYRDAKQNQKTLLTEQPFVAMLPEENKRHDNMFTVEIMNLDGFNVAYLHS